MLEFFQTTCQSGFRCGHSTTTSLLNRTDKWLYNIDNGVINVILFYDLRKAFDTVDRRVLIDKLKLYGVHGISLNLFKSYLSNRSQKCKINLASLQSAASWLDKPDLIFKSHYVCLWDLT